MWRLRKIAATEAHHPTQRYCLHTSTHCLSLRMPQMLVIQAAHIDPCAACRHQNLARKTRQDTDARAFTLYFTLAVDLSSRLAVAHRELRAVVALATRDGRASRDVGAHAPVAHPRTLVAGALNSEAVAALEDLALNMVRRLLVAGWRRDPAGDLLALLLFEETADQRQHTHGNGDTVEDFAALAAAGWFGRGLNDFSFGIGEAGGVSGRDDE
ncbi:hypothetical protein FI667_g1265, partial [Globisporangium splendens]